MQRNYSGSQINNTVDIFVNKMQRNYTGSQIKYIFDVLEKEFEEVILVNSLRKNVVPKQRPFKYE